MADIIITYNVNAKYHDMDVQVIDDAYNFVFKCIKKKYVLKGRIQKVHLSEKSMLNK